MEKDQTAETAEETSGPLVECIYFSAHWCPPCRGFTPQLAEMFSFINQHATMEELEANEEGWTKFKEEAAKKKAEEEAKKYAPLIEKAKVFEEQYKAK